MTIARFKREGNKYDIKISGHALFNPGLDPVCAGCSTLAYTLINVLKAEDDNGEGSAFNHFSFYTDKKDGVCIVKADVKPERMGYIDAEISVIATGFALLMSDNPRHVRFKYNDQD
jgi:uncharacterized protein YsxB (DUF464 family)